MFYIHKFQVSLEYGGPEEGGWNYKAGWPVENWQTVMVEDEETATAIVVALNFRERERRNDEPYEWHSVHSHQSQFFEYDVSESSVAEPFPAHRPHYE